MFMPHLSLITFCDAFNTLFQILRLLPLNLHTSLKSKLAKNLFKTVAHNINQKCNNAKTSKYRDHSNKLSNIAYWVHISIAKSCHSHNCKVHACVHISKRRLSLICLP